MSDGKRLDWAEITEEHVTADRPATEPRTATDALREVRERMTAAAADGWKFGYHEAMQCVEVVEASVEAKAAQGAAPRADEAANEWENGYQACYERMQEEGRLLPAAGRAAPRAEGLPSVEDLALEIGRHGLAFAPDGSPKCDCDGPWHDDHWYEEHLAATILARLSRPSDERVPESEER